MPTPGSLPDLSGWIALRADRPPRALHALFWGASLLTLALYALVLGRGETLPPAGTRAEIVVAASLAAPLLCCALWPLLPWSPGASRLRRAASGAFLVLSVLGCLGNNYVTFLLVCVATVNAVAVFGPPGWFAYTGCTVALPVAVALALPQVALWESLVAAGRLGFLSVVCGTVFTALVVAARRAERTREVLAELEEAHAELRRRSRRVRELTVAEERARMSREMHDSTGHYLTALTLALSNALRFREARTEAAWAEVRQARDLAREALTDTRRWVRALRPLSLEGRAGLAAMRAMADSFDGGGVRVVFTATGSWPELSGEAELVCYRALQEGLTNALRHSGGDRIEVVVAARPDGVAVRVTDNGRGAPEEAAADGFGLRGLAERAEAVGGTVRASSPPEGDRGTGFRLRVEVPAGPAMTGGTPETAGSGGAGPATAPVGPEGVREGAA